MNETYEKEQAEWKRLLMIPEFRILKFLLEEMIEKARCVLEEGDSADARAEIKVCRKILLTAENFENS